MEDLWPELVFVGLELLLDESFVKLYASTPKKTLEC